MANKDKTNDLSMFLEDFADGLRELYPEKKATSSKEKELINPQDFADLIAPDKYTDLLPENIRAKDNDDNPVSIFGVQGTYIGDPQAISIYTVKLTNSSAYSVKCDYLDRNKEYVTKTISKNDTIQIQSVPHSCVHVYPESTSRQINKVSLSETLQEHRSTDRKNMYVCLQKDASLAASHEIEITNIA